MDYTPEGNIILPRGIYNISEPIVIDLSALTTDPTDGVIDRVSVIGEGVGRTQIVCSHSGPAIEFKGGSGAGVHSYLDISGVGLVGPNRAVGSIGIKADNAAYFNFKNCDIFGFEYGIDATDLLSGSIDNTTIRSNDKGYIFQHGNFSRPNAIALNGVNVSGNRVYGGAVYGASCFNIFGGSMEGNGIGGTLADPTCWGLYAENCGVEGAVGVNIDGCYIEGNNGQADIWIVQTAEECLHTIKGSSFMRYLDTQYTTCNIQFDNGVNSPDTKVWVGGCGFKSKSPYEDSSLRPYVGSANNKIINGGNYFTSSTGLLPDVFV